MKHNQTPTTGQKDLATLDSPPSTPARGEQTSPLTVLGASLGALSMFGGGAAAALSAVGEACRTERVFATGPTISIKSLHLSDFDYVALTETGEEMKIPRWATLCTPPRDDMPESGSITPEQVVLDWPPFIPSVLAWHPIRKTVCDRYYIVMPEDSHNEQPGPHQADDGYLPSRDLIEPD